MLVPLDWYPSFARNYVVVDPPTQLGEHPLRFSQFGHCHPSPQGVIFWKWVHMVKLNYQHFWYHASSRDPHNVMPLEFLHYFTWALVDCTFENWPKCCALLVYIL